MLLPAICGFGNELKRVVPPWLLQGPLGPAYLGDPVGLNAAVDANGSLACSHSGSSQGLPNLVRDVTMLSLSLKLHTDGFPPRRILPSADFW